MELLYIDNLIQIIISLIKSTKLIQNKITNIKADFSITLNELINLLNTFKAESKINYTPLLEHKYITNLYATYVSYLPKNKRISPIKVIKDKRGSFAEMLKNKSFGQISLLK